MRIICGLGYKPWALPTPGVVKKSLKALDATDIEIRQAMYVYKPEVLEGISHAQQLKRQYFRRLPRIQQFIWDCRDYTKKHGYIRNWVGRKKRYNNPEQEAYKSVNALIQGGCAYILKDKLIDIDKFLRGKKSRLVNLIHDEIVVEVALDELDIIPELQELLVADQFKVLIDADVEYSITTWAEKKKFTGLEELKNEVAFSV